MWATRDIETACDNTSGHFCVGVCQVNQDRLGLRERSLGITSTTSSPGGRSKGLYIISSLVSTAASFAVSPESISTGSMMSSSTVADAALDGGGVTSVPAALEGSTPSWAAISLGPIKMVCNSFQQGRTSPAHSSLGHWPWTRRPSNTKKASRRVRGGTDLTPRSREVISINAISPSWTLLQSSYWKPSHLGQPYSIAVDASAESYYLRVITLHRGPKYLTTDVRPGHGTSKPPPRFFGREAPSWLVLIDWKFSIWTTPTCGFRTLLCATLGNRSTVSSLPTTSSNRERSMSWQLTVGVVTFEDGKEVTMCNCNRVIVQRSPIEVAPAVSPLLASDKQAKLFDHSKTGNGSRTPHSPFIIEAFNPHTHIEDSNRFLRAARRSLWCCHHIGAPWVIARIQVTDGGVHCIEMHSKAT